MGKSKADPARRRLFESPLDIVLVYFAISAAWILLSDSIAYNMVDDPETRNSISIIKGMVFVVLTSFLLFYLVKTGFDSLRSSEKSLRRSERRIRVMIERAPYGIIESDEKGIIVRANIKANEILATSLEELIGSNLKDFVVRSTDIVPTQEQSPALVFRDDVARFSRKNGKPIWVQRVSTPISDECDSERYFLEMIQDVTEQKESTIQLARRAEELEALYDVSRKMIESELATDSLEKICGVAVDRLHATSASVYNLDATGKMVIIAQKGTPPDLDPDIIADMANIGDAGSMIHGGQAWAVVPLTEGGTTIGAMVFGHSDPEWFSQDRMGPFQSLANLSLLSIQKVRMTDALKLYTNNLEEKVTERTKDLTDITQRLAEEVKRTKEAQEKLFQEKERMDVTLQSIGEGVIVTDIAGTVLLANRIAEASTDHPTSINGQRISDILPILDPLTESAVKDYWVAADPGEVSEKKGTVISLQDRRDISYNSASVRDRSGQVIGYVIVFRDITEDVKLQKAAAEAQRLESVGQLAGGIAHSFNNILTSILGNIELLSYGQLEAVRRDECLDDAKRSAIKAKELSNQLLTFAKGGEPVRKNISVLDIIKRSGEDLMGGSRINLRTLSDDDQYLVNADEFQIRQAFLNLMKNALASAPKGTILDVSISYQDINNFRSRSSVTSRYVVVNIEAPNWISQRAENIDPRGPGSRLDEKQGLDLAIANSIIRRHDGFVVIGPSAKGSSYNVNLLAWSECSNTSSVCAKRLLDRPAKVLIMDDDECVLEVLSGMIEALGHRVVGAKEGGEAIDLFAHADASGEPFDVIIMDLNIPGGLGGRETIRLLQERFSKVNAIVSSGYSNDPITANYISYGFKGVLPKPYTMKQLETAIQKALDSG